jgi:putative redox protein
MEEVEETTCVPLRLSCSGRGLDLSHNVFVMLWDEYSASVLRRSTLLSQTKTRLGGFDEDQVMECTVSWTGATGTRSGMGFVAETGSGHVLAMDGAPDDAHPAMGGQNLAPRPMETVLAGTGGCTAYDVVLILRRGRHEVRGCSVKLTSERAATDPKVFTKIHMHFTVTGRDLSAAAVERAIALSHDKYCSASIMLAKTAAITTSFDLVAA